MGDPYRDPELQCPACKVTLRAFQERLCCDTCDGIFLALDDLVRSLGEVTAVAGTTVKFADDEPGTRRCPKCMANMVRCRAVVELEGKRANPKAELDRCDKHGIWFDELELARVFEAAHGKAWQPAYAAGKPFLFGKKRF
jgi:Zn-finger nucleic acid-binding protein